ncbi:hypothetical protein V12B01_11095 [Vibrio splendidus 12B01]|nr:hypothetical protein V12B01_11095 [Vibrio splendidus 12B01]PHX05364.1 hypothetical protein VSPL_31470 [Vibrio splendidus]SBS66344.1 hypothetical protein VHE8714_03227 [Vibrio splendidus]
MSQTNDIKGIGQRTASKTLRDEGANNVSDCNNELFM